MIVTEVPFDIALLRGPALDLEGGGRSCDTLHLSQIYRDISDNLAPQRNSVSEEKLGIYAAGGFLWERVFERAMSDSIQQGEIIRPGEIMCEGIIGSPDNFNLRDGKVIETKFTWRSSNRLDSLEKNFWLWLVQIKGYCRMMGTQEAELWAYFCNGDYRGSGPIPRRLNFQFSQKEILDNWEMLKNHARRKRWL